MSQRWFATTSPGLETPLFQELRRLGARKIDPQTGGVEFQATNRSAASILFHLRCANRLYLRVDSFRSRDTHELYNKTRRIPWSRWLTENHELEIEAYTSESYLSHTGVISDTLYHAIDEHFTEDQRTTPPAFLLPASSSSPDASGKPPHSKSQPTSPHPKKSLHAQKLVARLHDNRCTLNLDASGRFLFHRGWKKKHTDAPLRETIAASLLELTPWLEGGTIIDPMAGSGTLLLEAFSIAHSLSPGTLRSFGMESWANSDPSSWNELRTTASSPLAQPTAPTTPPPITLIGFDNNPDALSIAERNRTKLLEVIKALPLHSNSNTSLQFALGDASELRPPPNSPPGLILTNAPYGKRINDDVTQSIRDLCTAYLDHFPGWTMFILLHRDHQPPVPERRRRVVAHFRNGGIPVRLWRVEP